MINIIKKLYVIDKEYNTFNKPKLNPFFYKKSLNSLCKNKYLFSNT